MNLDQLSEYTERINCLIEEIAEASHELLGKNLHKLFPLPVKETEDYLEELLDHEAFLSLQRLELRRVSWELHKAKGQIDGPRHFVKSIMDAMDGSKNEIEAFVRTVDSLSFAVKDRINYVRYRISKA